VGVGRRAAAVLLTLTAAAPAHAEVRRSCEMSYRLASDPLRWSEPQRATVAFLSPYELAARQPGLSVNHLAGHYALIWFADDQVAILEYDGITTVHPRVFDDAAFGLEFAATRLGDHEYRHANAGDPRPRRWRIAGRTCRVPMTYAQFDAAMMWVWAAFLPIVAGFVVWGLAAIVQDYRRRRRTLARLHQTLPRHDGGTEPSAPDRRQ
jgi:hypothetical protein